MRLKTNTNIGQSHMDSIDFAVRNFHLINRFKNTVIFMVNRLMIYKLVKSFW